jgi:hypothetical protein
VRLEPVADTGFASNGSVLDFVGTTNGTGGTDAPDPKNPETFTFATGCFPTSSPAIADPSEQALRVRGEHGAVAERTLRFNVEAHGLVSVLELITGDEDRAARTSGPASSRPRL